MKLIALTLALTLMSFDVEAQTAPVILGCGSTSDKVLCESEIVSLRGEGARLARGDYQAMRNAAFCQWTGCDGLVIVNRASSCAWRRQIIKKHYKDGGEADRTDESHLGACSRAGL